MSEDTNKTVTYEVIGVTKYKVRRISFSPGEVGIEEVGEMGDRGMAEALASFLQGKEKGKEDKE